MRGGVQGACMVASLLVAGALAGSAGAEGDAPLAGDPVTIEAVTARDRVFVGETFEVVVHVGIERGFLAERAIQPHRVELDVPLRVIPPWHETPPGLRALPAPEPQRGPTLAMGDDIVHAADEARPGDPWRRLVLRRAFRAERAGSVTFAAPTVAYAHATRFREDFVLGRMPLDRTDAEARGAPLTVAVVALPAAGRPAGFTGAIGTFRLSASVTPTVVDRGGNVRLTVRIDGDSNLRDFDPPALFPPTVSRPGWHVVGLIDDRAAPTRTLTYELKALDTGDAGLPPVRLAFFDPIAETYGETVSDPLAVTVRRPPGETAPPPSSTVPTDQADGPSVVALAAAAGLAVVLAILALVLVTRRRAAATPPSARDRTLTAIEAAGGETRALGDALAEYLADRLGCAPAAVVSPDLASRLQASGIPDELATRTATALESLVAARYGATTPADSATDSAAVTRIVDALHTHGLQSARTR